MPFANTRHVAADGDDGADGLSRGTAWKTYTKAVADAPADCEVLFYADTHNLAGLVNFPAVDLRLFRAVEPVRINVAADAFSPSIETLGATNQEHYGFVFEASATTWAMIRLANVGNRLTGCQLYTPAGCAVIVGGSTNTATGISITRTLMKTAGPHAMNPEGALTLANFVQSVTIDHCDLIADGAGLYALHGMFSGGDQSGVVVKNSILAAAGADVIRVRDGWASAFAGRYAGDRNCISRHLGATNVADVGGTKYATIGDWKAFVAPDDANSIDADPLWNNPAMRDWRLKVGSPAATLDEFGGPAGAFGVVAAALVRRAADGYLDVLGLS